MKSLDDALNGLAVIYPKNHPRKRHADPGVELALAVIEYFGTGPIDKWLTSDRALRDCALAIVRRANA